MSQSGHIGPLGGVSSGIPTGGARPGVGPRLPGREGESLGLGLTPADIRGMLRRHVALVVILFTLICGACLAATLFMFFRFPTYAATATIKVEPGYLESRSGGAIAPKDEAVPASALEQFVGMQLTAIASREVLETALSPESGNTITNALVPNERQSSSEEGLRERVRDIQANKTEFLGAGDQVAELGRQIQVTNPFRTMAIAIKLEGRDRQLIADVVNTVTESYLVQYKKERKDRERRFLAGLNDQKSILQPKLEEAERALTTFKRENAIFLTTQQAADVTGQMALYQDALAKADLERLQTELIKNQLDHQLEDTQLTPDMTLRIQSDPAMVAFKQRESELLRSKEQLLQSFGKDHEMVRALESQIATIKVQIEGRTNELQFTLAADQKQLVESAFENAKNKYLQILDKYKRVMQEALDKSELNIKFDILRTTYTKFQDEMKILEGAITNAMVSAEVSANSVSVASWASVPNADEKAGPRLLLYIPGSILLGLLVSLGLALLVELIDNRVRTPQQVIRQLQMPVLASVPDRKEDREVRVAEDLPLVSLKFPQSLLAESFRQLRTALMYSTDTDLRTLLLTSPRGGTGKSIVASNLAITLASGGSRVLLVDTNFRRATVHRLFDLPNALGLSSVLARLNTLDETIQSTTVANLDVLPCGPLPPSPADLLGSEAMQNLLAETSKRYDNVILDGAPLLIVSDAHVLCGMVDGVALVLDCQETSRGVASRARHMLQTLKARLVGVILNRIRAQKGGYFREAYQSYYDYSSTTPSKGR